MNAVDPKMGHNNPPSDVEILRDTLAAQNADILSRRDELLAACGRIPAITSDDIAGKVGDHVKLMTSCMKSADTKRVATKEPYLSAGRTVDGFFKGITDPLETAKKQVERNLTAYLQEKAAAERRRREEDARIAREEADRIAAEAAAAAAQVQTEADLGNAIAAEDSATTAQAEAAKAQKEADAKAADMSRTRGDYGAVSSLRTTWEFSDLNRDTLDLEALRQHIPIDALEKAVRAAIKAGVRELAGVRIYESTNAVVR